MKHTICIFLSLALSIICAAAGDLKLNTVVIDAGHGGKDAGAVSKDKKTYEKTLTLDIATRFSTLIRNAYPDLKVVMTRSSDQFVGLNERAVAANKAGANVFISIHINSSANTTPNGYSVHILGQSSDKNRDLFAYNMDVCKRENSVILLEDDYNAKYQGFNPNDEESYIFMQLMQNAHLEQSLLLASVISEKLKGGPIKADRGIWQNPFYVLWKTAMPAVLVELGFISNSVDLATLRSSEQRQILAKRLFDAFKDYKDLYDSSVDINRSREEAAKPQPATKPAEKPAPQPTPAPAPAATAKPQPATKPAEKSSASVATEDNDRRTAPAGYIRGSAPNNAGEGLLDSASSRIYGTQIFASARILQDGDPLFMGFKHQRINIGSLNKYIIGMSESEKEARELNVKIKEKYPTSFMVIISDGTVSRLR